MVIKQQSMIFRSLENKPFRKEGYSMYKKVILIVVLLPCLLAGCVQKSKEDLYKEGLKLMSQNNFGGAIVLFRNALQKDQNLYEARFQLAKAYYMTGRLEPAEKELKKVIQQYPTYKDAHLELARVYLALELPDRALSAIKDYLKGPSPSAEVLEIAGLSYKQKKEEALSMGYLKRALSIEPGRKRSAIVLSRLYLDRGNIRDSLKVINSALQKSPEDTDLLYTLSDIKLHQKDTEGALEIYDRILEKRPSDFTALFRKGIILISKRAYDEALKIARKLTKLYPKQFVGYKLKGIVSFFKKDYDNAVVFLDQALTKQADAGTYYYKGLSLFYTGKKEQALTAFYNALDQNPEFTKARLFVSLILLDKGRYDDAISQANYIIRQNQNNALAHNILGSAYMQKGMYEKGIEEFNRAIELDPKLVDAHLKKGLYLLKAGKSEPAEAEFKTAIKIAPDVMNSRVILASYYYRKRMYDKAISTLKDGLKGSRGDVILHNMIARVYLTEGRLDRSLEQLKKAINKNKDYIPSYFNLATLYFLRGQREDALKVLKTVLTIKPNELRALLFLASYYESSGNDALAASYYKKALETNNEKAYISFARYYLRKDKPEKAIETLDFALNMNLTAPQLYELKGLIQASLKRYSDAIDTFKQLKDIDRYKGVRYMVNTYLRENAPSYAIKLIKEELKKDPEDLRLLAELARVYNITKQTDRAISTALEMIRNAENSPVGYLALSATYIRTGHYNKALKSLKEGIEKNRRSIPLYLMLSSVYRIKKDYDKALSVLKKAQGIIPDSPDVSFTAGAIYQEIGDTENAIREYTKTLAFSSRHFPALNNLAYIYANDKRTAKQALALASRAYMLAPYKPEIQDTFGYTLLINGKVEEAIKLFLRALRAMPSNPSILYHIGLAYHKAGDNKRAIESLEKALRAGSFPEYKLTERLLKELKRG